MIDPIVQSPEPITLVGGAPVSATDLAEARRLAPIVVAADGGAATALAHGLTPEAVIGDMDSLSQADRDRVGADRVHQIAEQESTDFQKALSALDAPLVLALGFTGARLDHELAAYNVLVKGIGPPCIILGQTDLCFHAPLPLTLKLPVGTRVSLFPMREVTGGSDGLRWPIDGLTLSPWGRVGTSNETVAETTRIAPDGPGLLVILPRSCLSAAVRALRAGASG